ncbi:MAG: PQQ-binding-like beta-propeller repeat protein [Chloroflexi bacterium]|nr:PQQ-binding-like beta-propeller repeat protein [Chloroflexota bacterium]MBI5956493.1 PQQ-binding-like beta-propeller repeat protein [Chloroflexota bacterium]
MSMTSKEEPSGTEKLSTSSLDELAANTLPVGTVLQDRYEILGILGLGGMGAVYRARDRRFVSSERLCAIKEIVDLIPDPATRQVNLVNFEREANLLATLSHPAIPKIYDYFHEGNRVYLVLEFIDGEDLEAILEGTQSFLPEREVVDWAIQICDVLTYLHHHQPEPVIFRDLKPSNIMLTRAGRIVLIDFGIAKLFQADKKGTMVGTEGYSPPEQYKGMAEPRSDIYALGATLHHLLTRSDPRLETPFTFQERLPRAINPNLSGEVETAIMKALEYELEKRPASAEEMKRLLLNALGTESAGISRSALLGRLATVTSLKDRTTQLVWQFNCEEEVRSSPAAVEGLVVVGCYDNNLYALDAETGAFRWKFATEGGIASSPCFWRDAIFVGSEDYNLYAISLTGKLVWAYHTNGPVRSSPRVAHDLVYVGSDDQQVHAVDARWGKGVWRYVTWRPVRSSPAVYEAVVYIGSEDEYVYALDAITGTAKWKLHTMGGVISSPAVSQGLVFVGSLDRNLYALDADSGFAVWRASAEGYISSSPATDESRVFVGSVDKHLYSFDQKTGKLVWKFAADGQITSSPRLSPSALYFGSVDGYVYSLETKTGKLRWRFKTGGPVPGSAAISRDVVYIGSTDHKVYALRA